MSILEEVAKSLLEVCGLKAKTVKFKVVPANIGNLKKFKDIPEERLNSFKSKQYYTLGVDYSPITFLKQILSASLEEDKKDILDLLGLIEMQEENPFLPINFIFSFMADYITRSSHFVDNDGEKVGEFFFIFHSKFGEIFKNSAHIFEVAGTNIFLFENKEDLKKFVDILNDFIIDNSRGY